MELRMNRDLDGQLQYAPFRPTVFADRRDGLADARGPGALFREEWNSLAGNAERYKLLSLYRTERDVNPTPTATVQRFYNPQVSSDIGTQLKKKGNTVNSRVPRFHGSSDQASQRGPGSYFPDRVRKIVPPIPIQKALDLTYSSCSITEHFQHSSTR
ncbi:hypothetical protein PF005_g12074 [Phytophthora fragariae]|nr:hypothetical protein PF009_g11681 [Phytophthora fragariae]KAE9007362.1 hypothetical protein PF011_g11156 [Phytophthora fragariae]KAE9109135.1 hypothetical protein PF010_g11656 [Phytophthora fragariae]KAE9113709.1 hypothetical protein PF007_g10641 [Phytophthora fragariae]KAE9143474.1 hypothetical protein PF006_g11497 [Phytophthora fragariae]